MKAAETLNLFRGPLSLTYHGERLAFYLTLLCAFPAAAAIGFVLREDIHPSQIAVLVVIAMVYVTLARGRLVGSSVRIHESQYPRVFSIVRRCAAAMDLPVPLVFVRDDPFVPIVTVGLGDPYSLVISANWIEHFKDDELTFMVGRELGHIAAGHARFTSLLSVNGNENPLVSLIFGAWLRKSELTCDRIGLLCCGSLDAAMRAIIIASFHGFGRKIDHVVFAEQSREINADSVLRLGEWLGAMPYATKRIDAMRAFFATELYRIHENHFVQESALEPLPTPQSRGDLVTARDCAGWWRRVCSVVIDWIIVQALVTTLIGVTAGAAVDVSVRNGHATVNGPQSSAVRDSGDMFTLGGIGVHEAGITLGKGASLTWSQVRQSVTGAFLPVEICLYFGLLVGLAGQTPGMMILGLKVVTTNFSRPSIVQSLWRYGLGLAFSWLIIPLSPFSRIYLHDKFSNTRLIKTERVLSRAGAST
ncbi:MAG TPA: RDD family protein [Candidatus Baltobacteraceae bacterium]|nr:RDD family protein [Candidatus Baltobacteraceae bacterium]